MNSRDCNGQHTLLSLVTIVLVNKYKFWRLGQTEDGEQEYKVMFDQGFRLLFLSGPTPILGGAKE